MAKSKKSNKSGAKSSVKVRDMKAKKNPKGGASTDIFLKYDQSLKIKESPTINFGSLNFNKVLK